MAAPPRLGKFEAFLVSAPRGEVEELVGPHQRFGATGIGGVGVVDSAVLQRKDAHALLLRLGLIDMLIVVVGAVSLLFLGEGGSEVVPEVAPERRNPRKSPAHLPLVALELRQRGDRLTNETNVAAVQVGIDTIEVIGDQGTSGASAALVGEPESVAEHEVIDEELRASLKQVG